MAYQAIVLPVMIASPGDVFEEREIVREVIHSWNYIHSLKNRAILIPVGWETHASPELGTRAQELINSRILKECDLLVGVFWTRLGTPTGKAESGTVEEIEEHINAGKPAMIYFSSKPAAPESIDPEQYKTLQSFKARCSQLGLVEQFDNIIEFKEKVTRHLQICINNNPYIQSLLPDSARLGNDLQEQDSPPTVLRQRTHQMSKEATILLKAASKEPQGTILKVAVLGGRYIQAGKNTYGGAGGREGAKWEHGLNELLRLNLVVARGYKDEVFELTHEGWALADTLPENDI